MTRSDDSPSPRTLALTAGITAFVAGGILLVAVLPAEFGIDPLGTGRALGLLELGTASASPLENREQPHAQDSAEFVLEGFQSLEYKYHLNAGDTLVYSWDATGDLVFDMHADPDDLPGEENVRSFEQATGMSRSGVYHAPFTGIHGWFWENRSFEVVTLRLEASGFFDGVVLFRDGSRFDYFPEPVLE